MFHSIRQLEEKNVGNEIEILLWSDLMDLVAFSNVKGEVALHRLTWTRAWSLAPPKENDRVKGLAWRPDGKVLAIGYSSGVISLINIENKAILNSLEIDGTINCIQWSQEISETKTDKNNSNNTEENNIFKFIDNSSLFLPDFSTYGSNKTDTNNFNLLKNQNELNLLMIGTKEGYLYLSIFGSFPCLRIDINGFLGEKCSVVNIHTSESLHVIFITVKDLQGNLKIVFLNSNIFKSYKNEIFLLTLKYDYLSTLINRLSIGISDVKENWETILLEMDSKLSKFASKVTEETLSSHFLDLLMFGISSDEMQEFLLHDLTKKGLEKFSQTIEMCYGNIQKLLLKNIIIISQSLTYHLAELRGMARLENRYSVTGLQEQKITKAIEVNGSFLVKTGEMQQVINQSMISYKAFFHWLYSAIMNLMDEPIPAEIQKLTQQDISCIADFLLNFDRISSKNNLTSNEQAGFIIEKVGQYLSDSPLIIPAQTENNWNKFLLQNNCVKWHPAIINWDKHSSLVQLFNQLKTTIDDIFVYPKQSIIKNVEFMDSFTYLNVEKTVMTPCANLNSEELCSAFLSEQPPATGLYVIHYELAEGNVNAKASFLYFSKSEEMEECFRIVDVKFYSSSILSLLLQENNSIKTGYLCQFPVSFALENSQSVDLKKNLDTQNIVRVNGFGAEYLFKKIEGMSPCKISVSGNRKVSILLSDNKRKVRLYEMEVEEEDEDENDVTVSYVKDSDITF